LYFFLQLWFSLLFNIYSDLSQMTLKYLKNTEVNISNVLIMSGDFNIRDNSWNPNFLYYSFYSNVLFKVADSLHLELSKPTEQVPTRYSNNHQDSNLVINLIFLRLESLEHDNHTIYSNWRLTLDHAPLTIDISIFEKHIQTRKRTLAKNSKVLEQIVQLFVSNTERIWYKYSKVVNITKHSKNWGNGNCHRDLKTYKQ